MQISPNLAYQAYSLHQRAAQDFLPLNPRQNNLERGNSQVGQLPKVPANKETMMGKIEPKVCQTCAARRYQDSSTDPTASMQSPTRLTPGNEISAVLAHEHQHLVYRRQEAERENRKVIFQAVRIATAACPECGRMYVSGGQAITTTVPKIDTEELKKRGLKEPVARVLEAYQKWLAWNKEEAYANVTRESALSPKSPLISPVDLLA